MDKVIGGALGLIAFCGVCLAGLTCGASLQDTLIKSILALLGGFFIGWLVFGNIGILIIKGNLVKKEEKETK